MNVKLKKIKVLEPKIKIKAGLRTITREIHSSDIPAGCLVNSALISAGTAGIAEYEEE